MLYPTADYKVYAYISNTRIKFMLVVDDTQKDEKMRMVGSNRFSYAVLLLMRLSDLRTVADIQTISCSFC